MNKIIRTTALAGVALLALTACGDSGDNSEALGEGVDSGVQGIPVPEAAEERDDVEGAWTVGDADYDETVSWYEDRLPVDEEHEGLTYCETQESEDITSWLWWEEAPADHQGTPWLTTRVLDGDPVEVMVSYDADDVSDCL